MSLNKKMGSYYVYILKCSDSTLYTGWTNNLEKRVQKHNNGKSGAKYTRSRRPVTLAYTEACSSLPDALRREASIKKMSHQEKMQLIDSTSQQQVPIFK
ncbi:MAG: GIY-YIG nuclease superfamily protein [Syntrophus sp. PtaB.Bin001]|nr:MAG: GIY-YIG nuclease superfamily protein [Syntrophus sp. PtaB.Bin001]